jgi:hypothetical protein
MHPKTFAPVLSLILAACAAAVPGYVPEGSSHQSKFKVKAMESGTVAAGAYEPSADERKLDCRRLNGSIQIIVSRLRAADGTQESSFAAATVQRATSATVGGSTVGIDKAGELARERARAEAYNKLLAEKKCKQVDIAAELAKPSSSPAPPPVPTVSGRKS